MELAKIYAEFSKKNYFAVLSVEADSSSSP